MQKILAPLATSLAFLAAFGATAEELDEARVKELVYEAIRENPAIVMEAVEMLRQQEAADQAAAAEQALAANRDALENDPNAPVLGNPDGDVTVVEFFDYNCPYCKRASDEVKALLAGDGDIRLVYREWPILGEGSVFAARAALAARNQEKYEAFHEALMGLKGRAEEASVLQVAEDVGLDIDRLWDDMESAEVEEHLRTSMSLAQSLGFSGTPSFVIGTSLVPGFVEKAQLEELVGAARDAD